MARTPRAFTLIELMVVITIIGILASVAIPSYSKFQLRSKAAERSLVLSRIKSALEEKYVRDGRLTPQGSFFLMGNYEPAWPPTSSHRTPDWHAAGWRDLQMELEGAVFHSYLFMAFGGGAGGGEQVWVLAAGDLDSDNQYSMKQQLYQASSAGLVLTTEWPARGKEDDGSPPFSF